MSKNSNDYMIEYDEFVDLLKSELKNFHKQPKKSWKENALKYVDGYAADELRRLVSLEKRREYGTFFTENNLATKVLQLLDPELNEESIIYDPACGASNLLISVADYARKNKIARIDEKLFGTDIHNEFIEASRLRLQINNLLHNSSKVDKRKFQVNILQANGLHTNHFYQKATHVIVNPPFNLVESKNELSWAKGKVCNAALFIDRIIQFTNPGVLILAILPDVLRSGSRYEKWRKLVEQNCIVEKVKLLGQFDKYADVDVFAIKLIKRNEQIEINHANKKWLSSNKRASRTISDLFHVCVGTVVDNRDPIKGVSLRYIVSRGLPGWQETNEIILTRQHEGKSFRGPFIVIKRTSRMSDIRRAVATIINLPESAYVDNHLIVLVPKSGKISDCHKALEILNTDKTDRWINKQIRCRHLTVNVVKRIPV